MPNEHRVDRKPIFGEIRDVFSGERGTAIGAMAVAKIIVNSRSNYWHKPLSNANI
jgi:hypothetical protein